MTEMSCCQIQLFPLGSTVLQGDHAGAPTIDGKIVCGRFVATSPTYLFSTKNYQKSISHEQHHSVFRNLP
jgi:hypothetical protein